MLYTIHFHDNPHVDPDIRSKFMNQYLKFLINRKDVIRAAGPLKEENGLVRSELWLVELESAEQAWEQVKSDPFRATGLRDKVEIKLWLQVFDDGQALV